MYTININGFERKKQACELIEVFLRPDQFEISDETSGENLIMLNREGSQDKNTVYREIYDSLSEITGLSPDWGILTGIRPVKLCGEIYKDCGCSREKTYDILKNEYYLSDEKANMIIDIFFHQQESCGYIPPDSAGVYIGIPFCPTRCVYCSFASNQEPDSEIVKYLEALHKEIEYVGRRMKEKNIFAETIYIGGGTPTTLSAEQIDSLIKKVKESFDVSRLREFTIEAGRPDTITDDKLRVMKENNIDRISINPQSMKQKTLDLIGRNHTPSDILKAFETAEKYSFGSINADIIAGLPEESEEDFDNTLSKVIGLGPDNITVHCLAVKRASRLKDIDKDYHYKHAGVVEQMLADSRKMLKDAGYVPYYLYRQKHMAGAFENVGYVRGNTDCIYNIRIMDEHQTIIALGAGGISKAYFPEEDRLERVPNVTNYREYINRIDEMIERKEKNLFMEV